MRVIVGPAVLQSNSPKCTSGKLQTIGGIGACNVFDRIVAAPRGIAAIFNEVNLMPESGETHHILKVMPSHSPQWPAHQVAKHDNPQVVSPLQLLHAPSRLLQAAGSFRSCVARPRR